MARAAFFRRAETAGEMHHARLHAGGTFMRAGINRVHTGMGRMRSRRQPAHRRPMGVPAGTVSRAGMFLAEFVRSVGMIDGSAFQVPEVFLAGAGLADDPEGVAGTAAGAADEQDGAIGDFVEVLFQLLYGKKRCAGEVALVEFGGGAHVDDGQFPALRPDQFQGVFSGKRSGRRQGSGGVRHAGEGKKHGDGEGMEPVAGQGVLHGNLRV